MAVTLISEPDSVCSIDNLQFSLSLDSAGFAPEVKTIGYRLEDSAGNIIVPRPFSGVENQFIPYTGVAENLDFGKDVQDFLESDLPDLTATGITTDAGGTLDVVLYYGEITYNEDTGQTTVAVDTASSTITVINSRLQFWEDNPFGSLTLLSHRPTFNRIEVGQKDWLYIYAPAGQNFTVSAHYPKEANVAPDVDTFGTGAGLRILPIGTDSTLFSQPGVSPGETTYYPYKWVVQLPGLPAYTFVKENCSNDKDWLEIYWQEPLGGYSSIRFERMDSSGNRVGRTVKKPSLRGQHTYNERASRLGKLPFGISTGKAIRLSKTIPNSRDSMLWVEGLIGSTNVFVKSPYDPANIFRVNVQSGTYQTHIDETLLTVSLNLEAHEDLKAIKAA